MIKPLLKALMIFSMATLLTACLSNASQQTYFYVINPIPENTEGLEMAARGRPVAIEITSLSLPQYLERPQIVTRSTAHQLDINEYHRWGGNLRKNISRVLAKDLSIYLNTPDIFVVPHVSQQRITHRLMVEILAFEQRPDHVVTLSSRWTIKGLDQATTDIVKTEDLQVRLSGNTQFEDTVDAMGQLIGMLSHSIAEATIISARQHEMNGQGK